MKIWGYWATFGWSVLAFIVGQFLALAVLVWWRINDLDSILSTPFDGKSVTLFIVISNPLMIAVLAGAVWTWHRRGHAQAWIVFGAPLLLVWFFVADQVSSLLPNLL